MTSEQIQARYPRLLRAMQWVAILSTGEAAACLRDYKAGFPWSGEAVNHFGGTKIVLQRAVTARVRHFMVDLRNAERSERLLARINHELAAESAALGGD